MRGFDWRHTGMALNRHKFSWRIKVLLATADKVFLAATDKFIRQRLEELDETAGGILEALTSSPWPSPGPRQRFVQVHLKFNLNSKTLSRRRRPGYVHWHWQVHSGCQPEWQFRERDKREAPRELAKLKPRRHTVTSNLKGGYPLPWEPEKPRTSHGRGPACHWQ